MTPTPPVVAPPPGLADAVRAGRWSEVRALTAALPKLPAAVALAAARAERGLGNPARAKAVLLAALPGAGELGAALRLELGAVQLALGEDPMPVLEPLLRKAAPSAQRRAATEILRESWEVLKVETVRSHRRRGLSRPMRAELDATVAVRSQDQALAVAVLASGASHRADTRVSAWLATRPELPEGSRLDVARALLAGGLWREARALLAATAIPSNPERRAELSYLSCRAAYRTSDFEAAVSWCDRALAEATGSSQRFAAAVAASCWRCAVSASRCWAIACMRRWWALRSAWVIASVVLLHQVDCMPLRQSPKAPAGRSPSS